MSFLAQSTSGLLAVLVAAGVGISCSKPGDDSPAKRTPIPEPAPNANIPPAWSVPFELGDDLIRTLNTAELAGRVPDYEGEGRKAWRLDKILSDSEFPVGALLEAVGSDGVGIALRRQESTDAPVPVIVLTRRGVIVAAAIKTSDPFPNYHGQGGRLRRPGDPYPRLIMPLAKLHVSDRHTLATAHRQRAAGMSELLLQINDGPAAKLSSAVIASLSQLAATDEAGNSHAAWDVRELVKAAAGSGAILVSVGGGPKLTPELKIEIADWKSSEMRPRLQVNRRGQLKFQWTGAKGPTVHDVRLLRITSPNSNPNSNSK